MSAYVEGRYAHAASMLEAALSAGVDSLPAQFFHATSLLMLGHAGDAAAGYERVISQGDSPYLPEAHYYRAKVLLQLGRPDDALADLDAARILGGIVGGRADALADSVHRWLER
jgi:tetratricopeptide (TPR) repeat protein